MDTYNKVRNLISSQFTAVVAVVISFGGLSWPRGCATMENKKKYIDGFNVPITEGDVTTKWTEGVDAVYVFEGSEQLDRLYSKEHMQFLCALKGLA